MKQKDLVVYYPFYNGEKYQPMPHTLPGADGVYSDAKELFDFIKKCSLTEEECLERCKNLNGVNEGLIEKELKEQFTDLAETWQAPKGECYYNVSWNDLLKIANHFYNLGKEIEL